jgi:hypothetical protein
MLKQLLCWNQKNLDYKGNTMKEELEVTIENNKDLLNFILSGNIVAHYNFTKFYLELLDNYADDKNEYKRIIDKYQQKVTESLDSVTTTNDVISKYLNLDDDKLKEIYKILLDFN